ncbi:noncanonical pyrimidine nucleotidase, YjjG family [Sphingobacteriaceae bacterium]|nr:noncanonical pyrimidine nucleotidase, YjjG family [Sphingobacteriaceae bacterium]
MGACFVFYSPVFSGWHERMANLKHKKHLFFDFDDTLWDFQKNSSRVLEELYQEYELESKLKANLPDFLAAYKKTNLNFWSLYTKREIDKQFLRNHRFNETFKIFGYDNYDENLLITDQYLKRAPQGSCVKEGCVETLEYLRQNYKLHIITNGFKEVFGIKMNACGIRNYFDQIIISEEHALVKPDEKIFRLAEHFAGAKKDDCVMIGDSLESDIEGALNAGWEAIYLAEDEMHGFKGRSILRLEELKNIF